MSLVTARPVFRVGFFFFSGLGGGDGDSSGDDFFGGLPGGRLIFLLCLPAATGVTSSVSCGTRAGFLQSLFSGVFTGESLLGRNGEGLMGLRGEELMDARTGDLSMRRGLRG